METNNGWNLETCDVFWFLTIMPLFWAYNTTEGLRSVVLHCVLKITKTYYLTPKSFSVIFNECVSKQSITEQRLCLQNFTVAPPCSLAATMTSAEGSIKFHYYIPAPLQFIFWMNTFEGSKWSEVGPYSFFSCLMNTFKHGLALSRFYKILAGPVHV